MQEHAGICGFGTGFIVNPNGWFVSRVVFCLQGMCEFLLKLNKPREKDHSLIYILSVNHTGYTDGTIHYLQF